MPRTQFMTLPRDQLRIVDGVELAFRRFERLEHQLGYMRGLVVKEGCLAQLLKEPNFGWLVAHEDQVVTRIFASVTYRQIM